MSNVTKFRNAGVGYGTNAQLGLQYLNRVGWKGDAVIYVSDNESWMGKNSYYGGSATGMSTEWNKYVKRNRKAKMACIDIQAGSTTQVPDDSNVMNIGGFSDSVWPVIENFVHKGDTNFVDEINAVELDA